jgi:hypothetical protein
MMIQNDLLPCLALIDHHAYHQFHSTELDHGLSHDTLSCFRSPLIGKIKTLDIGWSTSESAG